MMERERFGRLFRSSIGIPIVLAVSVTANPQLAAQSTPTLSGVWGAAPTDVFAVGNSGTVLRLRDGWWQIVDTGLLTHFGGVWGAAGDDVYAVGFEYSDFPETIGVIAHFNGSTWSAVEVPGSQRFHDVWGSSANDVYVVGQGGEIRRFDGQAWVLAHTESGTIKDIWGSSATDIFAVGGPGIIVHYDGVAWSRMAYTSSLDLDGVWGFSSTDVFACGEGNVILRYDGVEWLSMSGQTGIDHFALWGASNNDIYAVGSALYINHYDGTSWSLENIGTTGTLFDVWGSSANNVFAVGSNMTILRNHGDGWSPVTGVNEETPHPLAELLQNVPNPFNPSTRIGFVVPESAHAKLAIYSIDGRLVATILDRVVRPGTTSVQWNGTDDDGRRVASGVYLYRVSTPGFTQTRKLVLIR
jgi:hypothetical protein